VEAASGPGGFWTTASPAAHFRTASTAGPELARAVATLLRQRPRLRRVVELGAGDGRLLTRLQAERPDLALVGVDVRDRPAGLAPAVGWRTDRWDVRTGGWTTGTLTEVLSAAEPTLVLAVEWLDDLPCRLAARRKGAWVELDVNRSAGPPLAADGQRWAERWWPDGDRIEVGTTRDRAWSVVIEGLAACGGAALMVDYGHERGTRPHGGTLTGYRAGRVVEPLPRADRNLTAHVAVDAVRAAGEEAGARTVLHGRQADVLPALLQPLDRAADPLADLASRSRRQALTRPTGWGAHRWLLQEVAPAGRTGVSDC
jgi:SAM-dependent MidA family methyltransferase